MVFVELRDYIHKVSTIVQCIMGINQRKLLMIKIAYDCVKTELLKYFDYMDQVFQAFHRGYDLLH